MFQGKMPGKRKDSKPGDEALICNQQSQARPSFWTFLKNSVGTVQPVVGFSLTIFTVHSKDRAMIQCNKSSIYTQMF